MARKRKKTKVKLSAETTNDQQWPIRADLLSEQKKDELELQSWSDLPADLLERVLSPLTLIENLRASAVCKPWQTVAVSARVVNKPPLLMYFPARDDIYEFYDPYTRKSFTVELKELLDPTICESRYGWLLVRWLEGTIAFFNPFTRVMMKLPNLPLCGPSVSFSCAPTDPSCIVFAFNFNIDSPDTVTISTCHPGAEMWSTATYHNELPYAAIIWNKFIFSSGLFYCLTVKGWLGVFNPRERTWDVLAVSRPRSFDTFYDDCWWEGRFLAEHKGELLAVYTCCVENPIILKLDRSALEWVRVESLDDVTLFAGFFSTLPRTDLPGKMRNCIFFSKVRLYGKHCISYSLKDRRYYPRNQCHDWGNEDQYECVWIDQPQDLSAFIEGR